MTETGMLMIMELLFKDSSRFSCGGLDEKLEKAARIFGMNPVVHVVRQREREIEWGPQNDPSVRYSLGLCVTRGEVTGIVYQERKGKLYEEMTLNFS